MLSCLFEIFIVYVQCTRKFERLKMKNLVLYSLSCFIQCDFVFALPNLIYLKMKSHTLHKNMASLLCGFAYSNLKLSSLRSHQTKIHPCWCLLSTTLINYWDICLCIPVCCWPPVTGKSKHNVQMWRIGGTWHFYLDIFSLDVVCCLITSFPFISFGNWYLLLMEKKFGGVFVV